MTHTLHRPAGWSLIAGTLVATAGYVATGMLDVTDRLYQPFYGVALGGDLLIVLGLPVILAHRARAARLTVVGYVGLLATMVMLNLGEGVIEAFAKPYLATHGGIPEEAPGGLAVYESVALLCLVAGLICLGIAVIRARVFPIWVGVLLILSPVAGFVGLSGALALTSDYLAFAALFGIGLHVVTDRVPRPALSMA